MKKMMFAAAMAAVTVGRLSALEFAPGNAQVAIAPRAPGPVQLAAEEMTNFLSRVLGKPVPIVRRINPAKATIILGTNTSFTFPDKAREAGYPNVNSTTTRTEIQQLPERKFNNYPNGAEGRLP